MAATEPPPPSPTIGPLGDSGLLIRFGSSLSDAANRAAVALAHRLRAEPPPGTAEIAANLVSVLVRYDPQRTGFEQLAGEIRLLLATLPAGELPAGRRHVLGAEFGGPDIEAVAARLGLSVDAFIAAHNARPLRVLATGFAPGFVYCGFHPPELVVPRRPAVRASVAAGTLLFAAGQTAITATTVPTGWHAIGRTGFSNFDPLAEPPTVLREGDAIVFKAIR